MWISTRLPQVLKAKRQAEFELGLCKRKALYKAMPFAYPARWALDPSTPLLFRIQRLWPGTKFSAVEKPREIVLTLLP